MTSAVEATQVVFLSFDRTGGANEVDFTQTARDGIQVAMEKDFAEFDFSFTQTEPLEGEYSTLYFNDGPAFGIADSIDFRNLNKSDNARIQTTVAFDPTPDTNDDMGDPINPNSFDNEADFAAFTAYVASHELGHIVGLRHRDGLGPVGSGFASDPGFLFVGDLLSNPTYPGPRTAVDTPNHIMETGITQGDLQSSLNQYFGAREAIKLSFNERGSVVPEAPGLKQTIETAQPITLATLEVPNTIENPEGVNLDFDFFVEAVTVTGRIASVLQKDFYSFAGQAGDLINVEVLSEVLSDRYDNTIDSRVMLFHSDGRLVDYYGTDAINNDEFETSDSILLDLYLPEDDTYFIRVDAEPAGLAIDTGDYELFVHRFSFESTETTFNEFDINQDGAVNAADYTIWRDTEGDIVPNGTGADLDGNGKIDLLDYEKWALNFGAQAQIDVVNGPFPPGMPSTAVPEPASAVLAGLLVGLAGWNRRRAA